MQVGAAQAAILLIKNSLIQTGTLTKFDAELINIRYQLYRTRVNGIDAYNDEYAVVQRWLCPS